MSQHDHVIDNASGAAVRADLNNALLAIVSQNSGASAPSTTYAYMRWPDTTNGVMKRRNAANSGWLVERTLDETLVLSRSSNTMLDVSDWGKELRATAGFTQTFDAVATLGDGWWVGVRVESGATLVLDPNSTETIDGATTLSIVGPASCVVYCNGSALFTRNLVTNTVLGTPQATTSGTSIDFTGIPSGVREIKLMFNGVSTNGTSSMLLQLGDSGGVETSGYTATVSSGTADATFTTGVGLGTSSAAHVVHGELTFSLQDSSDNTWTCSGVITFASIALMIAAVKATSATLDRVRLTTVGGTDAFDAGEVNISYSY